MFLIFYMLSVALGDRCLIAFIFHSWPVSPSCLTCDRSKNRFAIFFYFPWQKSRFLYWGEVIPVDVPLQDTE